jgi:hypothetical protein
MRSVEELSKVVGSRDREKVLKQMSKYIEGQPKWYNVPLDKLNFEWSEEEKLELDRYCEKILKNIAKEEMTPLDRMWATIKGEPKDRMLIHGLPMQVWSTRTLDSWADAVKPIDIYQHPKLMVKAFLATVARFKFDFCLFYTTTYAEEYWGANVKQIEYGNQVIVGDTPINTVEDLMNMVIPDPTQFGVIPGYLWACRELRRIYDETGLSKVYPLYIAH